MGGISHTVNVIYIKLIYFIVDVRVMVLNNCCVVCISTHLGFIDVCKKEKIFRQS